jgi:trimeric autotransporter adhesin
MTTLRLRKSIGLSPLQLAFLLLPLLLFCFALSPHARAVIPAPDGGYPNQNTAEGDDALLDLTTGMNDTAIGFAALLNNTTGNWNTANGAFALGSNTTGSNNTANGVNALVNNTTGIENTANGVNALYSNTTGNDNTAVGDNALLSNTIGILNTAIGQAALSSNTTGFDNTATAWSALFNNTTGNFNTANGDQALFNNTTGSTNTATGLQALYSNTTANYNTANGANALQSNTTGSSNTASGVGALYSNTTGNFNTATGFDALNHNTTGINNIAMGLLAGLNLTTGSNNIDIGNKGVAGEANTIRIGKQGTQTTTFVAGISGATVPAGVAVIVDSSGHLGTTTSSKRFKEDIKAMDKASEALFSLKPVRFRYKKEIDPVGISQLGLVAEDVEKVNPDLVVRDTEGNPYTVRYDQVNAMLLNEFLKEHSTVQELKSIVAKQEATAAHQQKQIEVLAAGLQKVSAQLELNRRTPKTVSNNH